MLFRIPPNSPFDAGNWRALSSRMLRINHRLDIRTFIEWYGVSPTMCNVIWGYLLQENVLEEIQKKQPICLLHALYYMKCYPKWHQGASTAHLSVPTFMDAVFAMICALEEMELVRTMLVYLVN